MFVIQNRPIGPGHPAYIIAEMSANHNGRYEEAEAIVRAAKDAGADAVKLQTYTPDTMTLDSAEPYFKIKGTIWDGLGLYDLYREAMTPWEWQPKLKKLADSIGIHLFSSPFDATAVDFLEKMGVPAHKVASFENGDIALLEKVAATKKPVIVSTGMATLEEIKEAIDTLRNAGSGPIALLKCTSAYPAPPEDMNLRAIGKLAETFGVAVGLSDHTLGHTVAVAAAALGANLFEKHLTLSRKTPGPDSSFSLEPDEFKAMVTAIREAEKALGRAVLGPAPHEEASRAFRRSLFICKDIKAGEIFTPENLRSIRPGNGLHPRHLKEVLGRRAASDIKRGTPLSWELVKK